MSRLLVLVMAAGCGRIGFGGDLGTNDGSSTAGDAADDATVDVAQLPKWSNGVVLPDVALAPVVIDQFRWMSTTTGAIYEVGQPDLRAAGGGLVGGVSFELVMMSDGSMLAVLAVDSMLIPSGTMLRPKGAYPLAIVARGDIVIEDGGVLEVDGNPAGGFTGGPGGGQGGDADNLAVLFAGTGCGGGGPGLADTTDGSQPTEADGGGAGGSYGTAGASAADHGDVTEIGIAVACSGPAFEPLVGGSGGGAGGAHLAAPITRLGGRGGGGGGALQLAAGGRIVINGRVSAAGGGGEDGGDAATVGTNWGGGGGGGAGGAILLEAREIQIGPTGRLTANGGGGGGSVGTNRGSVSQDLAPASGSPGDSGAVAGGTGCVVGTAAAAGPASSDDAGGGGGGCGIIRIVNADGSVPTGLISPSPTTGVLTFVQ